MKDIKTDSFFFFWGNRTYTFTKNRTLIVAPVRWGKTTLLAHIARFMTEHYGVLVIFISPNLNNLQEDWIDKHTMLQLQDNLDLECTLMKDGGINTMFGDALDPDPVKRIYSTHKHSRWLSDLERALDQIKRFQDKIDKKIVFLVDEVHGVERDNASNDMLMRCMQKMSEIGYVIAATATPHRNLGSDFWQEYMTIDYPEGVTPPHKTDLIPVSDEDLQLLRDKVCIPETLVESLRTQMQKNSWNICPVVGQREIAWHEWFCREIVKHFPQSLQLRISGGDYVLYRDGVELELKKLLKNDARFKKIASVQQAVTAVTDHLCKDGRDTLDLFTVGHNQIEEGQTHGNFKGDRVPTLQLIVPAKGPVFDDKFMQWNRLEHVKASKLGINPVMFTEKERWDDNYTATEHIREHAEHLAKGLEFNKPLPETLKLKSAAKDAGRYIDTICPEFQNKLDNSPLITEYKEFSLSLIDSLVSEKDPSWVDGFVYHRERGYKGKRNDVFRRVISDLCDFEDALTIRVIQGSPHTEFFDNEGKASGNDVSVYINAKPGSSGFKQRDVLAWIRGDTVCVVRRLRDVEWDASVGAKTHDWNGDVRPVVSSLVKKIPKISIRNQKTAASK